MPLTPGTRLGPYEVINAVGAGGMGEVYKARDTRLDRAVAVKILASALTGIPDLRERFDREARAVSTLSHPHICALYDIGHDEALGLDYLVLEYLEGETVAARLTRGPLPIDDVLRTAIEIADALDKAHRAGIVHRDLKPGNVMLTRSGAKLLDFGLSKTGVAGPAGGMSMMPTRPANLTAAGTILGTFQYMAPEQLEGGEADSRTDIFAFGALIYEMATGRKAFEGKSQASLIAAIIDSQPAPPSSIQPLVPASLDFVVATCLAKNPDDRYQSAHDLRTQLKWVAGASSSQAAPSQTSARPHRTRSTAPWIIAAVAVLAAAGAVVPAVRHVLESPNQPELSRFVVLAPEGARFSDAPEISPDGRRLALIGVDQTGLRRLWVRSVDSLEARPLPGTENATYPFWSPDSRYIAFFAPGQLKRIDPVGGLPVVIGEAPSGRGGAWSREGVILFASTQASGLLQIPAAGGKASPATAMDAAIGETSHRFPHFLPDGRHFMYVTLAAKPENQGLWLARLGSSERVKLASPDTEARYASGHLLFGQQNTLVARPFDLDRLAFTSDDAVPVELEVRFRSNTMGLAFSVSDTGVLVYEGGKGSVTTQLTWFDRNGKTIGQVGEPSVNWAPELSPDGRHAAVSIQQGSNWDIWLLDLARNARTRFTTDEAAEWGPIWSPDGAFIAYSSEVGSKPANLYRRRADATAAEQLLLETPSVKTPTSWAPDGTLLVYTVQNPQRGTLGVSVFPLGTDGQPYAFLDTESNQLHAVLSPDGRWVAYTSDASGRSEVYVQSFPRKGPAAQISTDGGSMPRWRRDGKELYFITAAMKLASARITLGSTVEVGTATPLFEARVPADTERTEYDVTADGQRFLVNVSLERAGTPASVVVNWPAAIRK